MKAHVRNAALRNGTAAASLANIAMLYDWATILDPARTSRGWGSPSAESCWAAVVVLGIAFASGFVATVAMLKWPSNFARAAIDWLLLAGALLIVNSVRLVSGVMLPTANTWFAARGRPLLVVAALVFAVTAYFRRRSLARGFAVALLAVSPLVAWNAARAVLVALTTDFEALNPRGPVSQPTTPVPGPRVVVIVFDEMDYRLAFEERVPGFSLPAFDQLRTQSLFATAAFPPGRETGLSLPSYLVGTRLDSVAKVAPDRVTGRFVGERVIRTISSEKTLFDDARDLGAASELVGFHLPYCRWALAASIDRCTWRPISWGGIADGPIGLWGAIERELLSIVAVGNRVAHIERIETLVAESMRAVADSNLRLIFLHLPEPHFPPVWDAKRGKFTLFQLRTSGYFGNMALADETLSREILAKTHNAGLDENTAFICHVGSSLRGSALSRRP